MVDAFQPKFDAEDGSFWMAYEEFFEYFNNLTICKVQNWHELRLKGKFIKVIEESPEASDWVISQFYYTFHLANKAHVEIGIHQEDNRILGANRRPYLDMTFIILKQEDTMEFTYIGMADLEVARDVEDAFNLEPGHYIVVPYTTGGRLCTNSEAFDEVPLKVNKDGKSVWNPWLKSTLSDIFRKIDLQLDGILTARELNIFGQITNDLFFQNLTQESFLEKEFENISHVEEGLTHHGFLQVLMGYSEQKLSKMMESLGYDTSLQSTKSRVFTLTFHSTEEMAIKVGNGVLSDINEKAVTLMMTDYLEKAGANKAREDKNVVIYRKYHEKGYANTYAAVNKTSSNVEVKIDMNRSNN